MNGNWKSELKNITHNKGVDVVYDSVGSTLLDSFEVTKECGTVVFYGMSGGDPPLVNPRMLMDGSKTLVGMLYVYISIITRLYMHIILFYIYCYMYIYILGGDLWSYITTYEERNTRAQVLFNLYIQQKLLIHPPVLIPLSNGRAAHELLESGRNLSKILLIPDIYMEGV